MENVEDFGGFGGLVVKSPPKSNSRGHVQYISAPPPQLSYSRISTLIGAKVQPQLKHMSFASHKLFSAPLLQPHVVVIRFTLLSCLKKQNISKMLGLWLTFVLPYCILR